MQPRDLSEHGVYRAGRGVDAVAEAYDRDPGEFVVLSSNENPLGPAPTAVEAIRDHAGGVHRYPKAAHVELTDAIADEWGVGTEQVWLAAGADGALDYLGRAILDPSDRVLVPDPGFAYYGMSARFNHATIDEYPLDKANGFPLTADTVLDAYDGHRIVYLTTPHNPTGATMAAEDIEAVAAETNRETLVVVDEAYAEFADATSTISLVADRDDVAVLRTFSKAYGLAGLRVGYAIVPEQWASAYERVNTPFAVNELACHAARAALQDRSHVHQTVEQVAWSRDHYHETIGAPTYPSQANFVLVDVDHVPHGDYDSSAAAVTTTLESEGVLVRDCTSFGLANCIRVTCGTERETRRATQAINEVVAR